MGQETAQCQTPDSVCSSLNWLQMEGFDILWFLV